MNVFTKLGAWFKKLGKFVWEGLEQAGVKGLTDELVQEALAWAKVAAQQALSNDKKREFVVRALVARFPLVPESVIRLAVELAVQILKKQVEKL